MNNIRQSKWYPVLVTMLLFFATASVRAAVWQWSAPVTSVVSSETNEHPRAFLWIPPNCKQVRGVVVGQHNMTEECILEHPEFRKTLAQLGFAEVWVTPVLNLVFDFNNGAGDQFNDMMKSLADVSGYGELEFAPVIPIGHSACASYPWNFAAWNPQRTLAAISIHGDAPLTNLTGSGRPNPDWDNRDVNGVPGLMVMGEYEWWENRLDPAMAFRQRFPKAAVSLLADAGHGHFDVSDALVGYLCLFLRKAALYRLPKWMPVAGEAALLPVDVQKGWLADRWRKDRLPLCPSAPYGVFNGKRDEAFWYFDKQMAMATEKYYAYARGKKEQYIGFEQNGKLLSFNTKHHARFVAKFEPGADGLTFNVKPVFTDTLRAARVDAHARGKANVTRICGPVEKVNDTTFAVSFYRMGLNNVKRTGDIWLMAANEGDKHYKSTVQQFNVRIPHRNNEGAEQHIAFKELPDINVGVKSVELMATSDSGLPVYFYVREGPAEIKKGKLYLTKIPPKSKLPVKVTVVAWQYGRATLPLVKTAEPVTRSFYVM